MMGAKVLISFIWLNIILAGVQAYDLMPTDDTALALNISLSLEDYIDQMQRQFSSVIARDEAVLTEFRESFEKQLSAMDAPRRFIELELYTVDKKLYSLQFLSQLTQFCVQKYRGLLYKVSAVTEGFNSCIRTARSYVNVMLQSCQTNIDYLKQHLNTHYKNGLTDCEQKNNNSYVNHTICVLNLSNDITYLFKAQQSTFLINLEAAQCAANTRILLTAECIFKTVNASLTSIGTTTSVIDGCINGLESCDNCPHGNGNNDNNGTSIIVPEPQCPNVVNIITGTELYRNETIRNPFIGLNSTLDCILINFLQSN